MTLTLARSNLAGSSGIRSARRRDPALLRCGHINPRVARRHEGYLLQDADLLRAPRSSKTHRRRLAPIFFLWLAGNADGSTREGMGFRAEPTVLAAPNTEVL